jgi:hypothetical protein
VLRALLLAEPTCHSRLRSGMLITRTCAVGTPALSVPSAESIEARNAVTLVMAASELVQASLAPMRMVTYPARCDTTVAACPGMSATFAPERASLEFLPSMAGCTARMRR